VLPEEDAAEFRAHAAALIAELAPVGALESVLAERVAIAAWRVARADRIEAELFDECRFPQGGLGLALIRDGNGTRSFETLLRYRGAAMAEFTRALRTLKALQAERAAVIELPAGRHAKAEASAPRSPVRTSGRPTPDRPAPRRSPSEPRPQRNPNQPEPLPNATPLEELESLLRSGHLPIRANPAPAPACAGPQRLPAAPTASWRRSASPG
jgi:hypothetical protein